MAKSTISRFSSHVGILSVVALLALTGSAHWVSAEETVPPERARIMTPGEIYVLYRDKSWQWQSGAGYMKDQGRQFIAVVDGESGKSWAEGRWVITETGRMCLRATWHSTSGAFPANTCFSHRIDDGTIYQKSEPNGEWYIFRHAQPRPDDEASKLADADLVSDQMALVKTALNLEESSE